MSRSAPVVPGFVTVGGAGEVLHLAPRSVRDLIYTGRLPSVRLGRRHFVSTADLELERRRRLGLPLPRPRVARPKPTRPAVDVGPRPSRTPADPTARARRAGERAAALQRWLAAGHRARVESGPAGPAGLERAELAERAELPFRPEAARAGATCAVCGRALRAGERAFLAVAVEHPGAIACLSCGRRALLAWADQRTREAAAARQLARQPRRSEAQREPDGSHEAQTARAA